MRFNTVFASAIAVIATVSAQTNSTVPSQACLQCVSNNVMAVVACKGQAFSPSFNPNITVSPAMLRCVCILAQNMTWATSCESSADCPVATFIAPILTSFANIKAHNCSGVNISGGSSTSSSATASPTGTSAPSGASAAGALSISMTSAVFVIAAAIAQALF
ncbi:hypothetical protein BGX26_004364 [Mortierella sp. AD094]|nr:hypothetical protein BGX26_004364 [Mortierella sp. AD094]